MATPTPTGLPGPQETELQRIKYQEALVRLAAAKWELRAKRHAAIAAMLGIPSLGGAALWAALRRTPGLSSDPVFTFGHPSQAFILHAIQVGAIGFFVRWHRRWLRETAASLLKAAPNAPIAQKTLRQFTVGWECMWYGWMLLYIWFTVAALTPLARQEWVDCVSDGFDVLSGCAFWWCYLSLEVPSVKLSSDRTRDRPFWAAVVLLSITAPTCIVLATIDHTQHIGQFGIVLVGGFNALGLACLVGRLGSHYIGTPRWEVVLLYFYAMLQILYSFLGLLKTEVWTLAVFVCAFLLKAVMFHAGYKMMKDGGLIRYLEAADSGLLNATGLSDARWAEVIKAASAV